MMGPRVLIAAFCLLLASAAPEDKFRAFEEKFEKKYESLEERARRFAIFTKNLEQIEKFQSVEGGSAIYTHLTPFADLTPEEFSARNGFKASIRSSSAPAKPAEALDTSSLPDSFDWRDKGAVNPVKNQEQCGSCWAFATVANIEGAGFVENKKLLSLSEQELVDCDKKTGDEGCQGGLPSNAYADMIQNNLGLETEAAYPYAAKDGQCKASASKEKAFISGWKNISTDEDQIAAALMQYGPLAIGINAGPMQFYGGGVANPSKKQCNPKELDHGVAIVGFGVDSGKKYWTIRNSWGASWGEHGYYRIIRGTGACGLNTMVTTATGITLKGTSLAAPEDKFRKFEEKFEKTYESLEERARRFAIFTKNLEQIEKFQSVEGGSAIYTHLTPFADLTPEEFSARNGFKASIRSGSAPAKPAEALDTSSLPDGFDWRDKGAVNPVKNQAQCGSCWAFATVANIEGAGFVENKKLLSLSEQELVDCDKKTGDEGCQGGLPSNAYADMIQNNIGLETEAAYPYAAKDGQCKASVSNEKAFISDWKNISTDEDQIAAALMQYGPLAIGINAGPMQWYGGGVANPLKILCNPKSLDHGVAIVGFGVDSGKKYWTIRNSWGASWGEHGYYRIIRGTGACGLNTMVTTATGITLKGASSTEIVV